MSEREILFRGKRVDNGEWIEGYFLPGNERKSLHPCIFVYLPETQSFECFDIDIDTLSEYTSLTDKNGTRIFEGDIVKQEFSKFRQGTNGICEFHDSSFGLKIKDLGIEKFLPFACICNATYEVVGNIHDNPELLKGA